jgi:hypothetical protein
VPRVIVSVKKAGQGSGKSGLTRYIAESKRDPAREGLGTKERRPLFTDREDRLTFSAANQHLTRGNGAPTNEDIIHLVISPEAGQFDSLGLTLAERKEKFREITRATMRELERELGLRGLHWAAGIHLNTSNPHTHVAIDRDAVDRRTGLPVRIEHLPRRLLTHNEKQHDGSKVLVPGKLADAFVEGLDKCRVHVHAPGVRAQAKDQSITPEMSAESKVRPREEGRVEPPVAFTPDQITRVEPRPPGRRDAEEHARPDGIAQAAEENVHLPAEREERESKVAGLTDAERRRDDSAQGRAAPARQAPAAEAHDHDEHALMH